MDVMNGIFNKTRTNDLNQALKVLSEKNKQIARNIANADTPYYKAKKLEFSEVMGEYYNGTSGRLYETSSSHMDKTGSNMLTTNGKHLQVAPVEAGITSFVRHQNNPSLRTDGNDVNLDFEMSEQATASIQYTLFTEIAGGKFAALKEIIRTR